MTWEGKMDADLKSKWVQALRSGEYKQGLDKLHDEENGTYCCLGVLCKVTGAKYEPYSYSSEATFLLGDKKISEDEALTSEYRAVIRISDSDQTDLIKMNDSGVPFTKIADHIERYL